MTLCYGINVLNRRCTLRFTRDRRIFGPIPLTELAPQKSADDLERMLNSNFELSNTLNDKIMGFHSGEDPDCDLTCLLEIQ